jgi:NADH-quinone oxidoreductase subunit H
MIAPMLGHVLAAATTGTPPPCSPEALKTAVCSDPIMHTISASGYSWSILLVIVVKVLMAFVLLLVSVMAYIWALRKWIADMQNRIGPNNAGPHGVFQTLADGIKFFFKEQTVPDSADRPVFRLAPYLSILPAFLMFCVIPVGGLVSMFGHQTFLQVAELPFGAMWILACSGLGVYGVMLAGWASGSKYPLLGSVRASAQMLSYEAAFGLGILGALIHAGTLSTREIVNLQGWDSIRSIVADWYWVPALVAFGIFLIAAIAETNHPPFDLVEAEQELVGGFHTEYSGIRFAIFFLAEFMNLITMSAVAVTLFLGGPSGPALWPSRFGWHTGVVNTWLMPVFWFGLKVIALLYGTVWLRASLPRLRYDQLMALGWKYLIELAILWVVIEIAGQVAATENWNRALAIVVAAVGAILLYGLLMLCVPRPGEIVEEFR